MKNIPRPLLLLAMTLTLIRNKVNKLNSVFILSIFPVLIECVGMCVFSFLYLFCDHFLLAEAAAFRVIPEFSQYSQTLFQGTDSFIYSPCSKRLAMLSCICSTISFSSTDSYLFHYIPVDSCQFNCLLLTQATWATLLA